MPTSQTIQQTFAVNPEIGFAGDVARPNEPHATDSGTLHVPSSATRKPRPGDALYYSTSEDEWAVPTNAAQSALVAGILHYRKDLVQNMAGVLEFDDEAEIEIGVFGTFWVVAGSAIAHGDLIAQDRSDHQWDTVGGISADAVEIPASGAGALPSTWNSGTATTVVNTVIASLKDQITSGLHRVPIVCVSRDGAAAAGDIIEARIGFGRVR